MSFPEIRGTCSINRWKKYSINVQVIIPHRNRTILVILFRNALQLYKKTDKEIKTKVKIKVDIQNRS